MHSNSSSCLLSHSQLRTRYLAHWLNKVALGMSHYGKYPKYLSVSSRWKLPTNKCEPILFTNCWYFDFEIKFFFRKKIFCKWRVYSAFLKKMMNGMYKYTWKNSRGLDYWSKIDCFSLLRSQKCFGAVDNLVSVGPQLPFCYLPTFKYINFEGAR